MPIFKRLDHVSIGVKNIEEASAFFKDILGAEPLRDRGAAAAEQFSWETFNLGGKKVELVAPDKVGEGGVGRYIEKHGEGFHHLSISVENLEEAIGYFESKGVRVLAPSFEDENWKHCYLHPKDTYGALIQIFEETPQTESNAL